MSEIVKDVMVDVKQIKNELEVDIKNEQEADIKEKAEIFYRDEETKCEDGNRTTYSCGKDVGNTAGVPIKNELEDVTTKDQLDTGHVGDVLLKEEHCGTEEGDLHEVQCKESGAMQNTGTFLEQSLKREEEEEPRFHFVDVTLNEDQEEVTEGTNICMSDSGRVENHDNEETFECTHCSVSFNTRKSLEAHVSEHKKEHHYECDSCGKKFCTSSELKIHSFTHTNECSVCNKAYRCINSLNSHGHRHKEDVFKCEVCGDIFKGIKNLEEHKLIHSRTYACRLCNKTFTEPSVFYSHKHKHLNEHHVCPVCEKVFTLELYLKRHMVTHEKNRRVYACKVCDKPFMHASSRSKHERSHSNK